MQVFESGVGVDLCLVVSWFVTKDALKLVESLVVAPPKIAVWFGLYEHWYADQGGPGQAAPLKLCDDRVAGA